MQFLESSVIGLRAARHRLVADDHPAEVTLLPMLHVGEQRFFDRVAAEAQSHDVVLVEGVRSRTVWFLTRAYRWLPLKRLGLVAQGRISPSHGGAEVIHADISPDEFERLWRALPWWQRFAFAAAGLAYGAWLRLSASRASIARRQSTTDLPDRGIALAHDTPVGGFFSVILHARDAHLAGVLAAELGKARGRPVRIAVVYGAAHMPAVLAELRAHGGFRPVESEWLEVIRL